MQKTKNKTLTKWVLLAPCLYFIFGLTSCVTNQQVVYFQSADSLRLAQLPSVIPTVSKIQPDDILAVTVASFNLESNEILNFANINALTMSSFPGLVGGGMQGRQPLGYRVDSSGGIVIPFIGRQQVAGYTLEQSAERIRVEVEKYLKEPSVDVRFLNHKFTVMGEVNRVGTYNLLDDRTTLLEGISMAGDLTIFGDRTTVTVVRKNEQTSELAKINLLTREVFESPYYYLKNGDVIYVEPIKGRVTFTDQRIQLVPIITGLATTFVVILNLLIR
jgi:polysaccharide export outer membrane protein